MLAATILPDPKQLHLRALIEERGAIRAVVATCAKEAACPVCGHRCARIHSRYIRQVADLPWHGVPLHLELHLRRFFCDQPECPRQIFAERLPGVVEPYARRTVQLADALTLIGFALGGEAGARLARHLVQRSSQISPDTLLRLVRREMIAAVQTPTPRILSVDDFAFHRGLRYGTILVDLERHHVVDLLPDREAETFAAWLHAHPGVEVVSRDRGGAYAEGARQAAPQALQVADRFHLLQNLGMALDRLLTREHRALTQAAQAAQAAQQSECPTSHTDAEQAVPEDTVAPMTVVGGPECDGWVTPSTLPTRAERAHAAAEARRQARYAHVVALYQAGHSIQAIARLAGLARNTVSRYLHSDTYPEPAPRRRRVHACDRFADYLRQRWQTGEHNSAVLLAELRAQGYTGSASTLRQYVLPWRSGPRRLGRRATDANENGTSGGSVSRRRTFSPRQTRWVLVRPLEDLDDAERAYRQSVCQQSPTIARAQALGEAFWCLVRQRDSRAADSQWTCTELDGWLAAATASAIPELVSFANGIRRDYDAVAAAFVSPWSQGQTEGHVNRLKLLKRQSYGRAGLDLLRQRVLSRSA